MRPSFLLPIVLSTLAPAAGLFAQTTKSDASAMLHKAVTPQYAGTFSPISGFTTQGTSGRSAGTRLVVNNGILQNYYSYGGIGQEWVDNNKLYDLSTDHTEQVNGIHFIYCSSDTNPNGVSVTMNFYDESVYCAGPTNWPTADCSYEIADLPGAQNGNLACWSVDVDLGGVECNLTSDPTGARSLGWGQVWHNDETGPWLADGGYGQTCSFTWFDTNTNTFLGCYWFSCMPHEGFYLQLFGGPIDTNRYWADDLGGASTAFDNGLLDVDFEVKSGNTCTFTLTDTMATGFTHMKLFSSPNPAISPISAFGGNVLIDPLTATPQPVGGTSQTYTIPNLGGDYYTQAACFSNGNLVGFSNALRHQAL